MQYKTLDEQIENAINILKKNEVLMDILHFISTLNLPNYYIASGCVFQTIWNYYDNKPLDNGIKDIDIIYFNKEDMTVETDLKYYSLVKEYCLSKGYKCEIDVSNEARMHIWRRKNLGIDAKPYKNSEDAIGSWLATVNSVGITEEHGTIRIYAPYGLSDIYSRTIRPVKSSGNTKERYDKKAASWKSRFDNLNIIEL